MLSLAHAVFFILDVLPEEDFEQNVTVFFDEIHKRLADFEENVSVVAFILANLMELRIILESVTTHSGTNDHGDDITPLPRRNNLRNSILIVDGAVSTMFTHLCVLQRKLLDDLLPSSILEHQHLREFKVKESIYKKIFSSPSTTKLLDRIDHFYNLNAYFCLPDVAIINCFSYLLSYVDFVSFNSLLANSLARTGQSKSNIIFRKLKNSASA